MPIKILVVDYGESAVRIAKSITELGYIPIGVYTDRDVLSDRRRIFKIDIKIPSFKDTDSIIKVAEEYGVDAIYPGSSYLSEDYDFAKKVVEKGFIYINTPLDTLSKMRNRIYVMKLFEENKLPTPNWIIVKDIDDIYSFAKEYGYPLLIRSVHGGYMSIISSENSVKEVFEKIRSELHDRGVREFIVESVGNSYKYIEVQLISDGSNTIHLFDRDTSIFFNNRVIMCEAPAYIVDSEIREKYLRESLNFIGNIGFIGVCSIGLIYNIRDRNYFFVDFTPRLKREHYVSEAITGVDIVKKQLSIVFEKKLDLRQEKLIISGHGISVFIDTFNPIKKKYSIGSIEYYSEPSGMGIRVESIIDTGVEVASEYADPVASVTIWGFNRYEALHRLESVLDQYIITGVETNIPFIKSILSHPIFRKGYYSIDFIEKNWLDLVYEVKDREKLHAVLLLSVLQNSGRRIDQRKEVKRIANVYYDTKVSGIKRKAWFYWVRLRRRVSRR